MRRHVTGLIFALMILFSITCSGTTVGKRAIDLNELSDFTDIVEPVSHTKATKSKNFPYTEGNHKRYSQQHPHLRSLTDYGDKETDDTKSTNTKMTTPPPKDIVNSLLNFKMRQYQRPVLLHRRKRFSDKIYSRRSTYLGHLADEINDLNLKMQNYAATMMVVLPSTKTQLTSVSPKVLSKVRSPPAENRWEVDSTKPVLSPYNYELDQELLKVYSNSFSPSAPMFSSMSPEQKQIMSSMATVKTAFSTSGSTQFVGARVTKSPSPVTFTTIATSHSPTSPSTESPLLTSTPSSDSTSMKFVTVHSDDDYPLLSADGFYSSFIHDSDTKQSNQQKRQILFDKKREIDTEDFGIPISNFKELLKIVPVNVNDDLSAVLEDTREFNTLPYRRDSLYTLSNMKSLSRATAFTTTQNSRANDPKTTRSNPYTWENEVIKELNVKIKKEIPLTKTTFKAKNVSPSPRKTQVSFAAKPPRNDPKKMEGRDANNSSTTIAAVTTTSSPAHSTSSEAGAHENTTSCHGKVCDKVLAGHKVYNDSSDDCNEHSKSDKDAAAGGGYDIISNDDEEETSTVHPLTHMCHEVNTTTTTQKSPAICGVEREQAKSGCGVDYDETLEPDDSCDRSWETTAKPKEKGCKHHKQHHHKEAKNSKHMQKRQLGVNNPQLIPLSLLQTQPPHNLISEWQSGSYSNTNGPRSISEVTPATPITQIPVSPMLLPQWTNANSAYAGLSTYIPNFGHLVKKSIDGNTVATVIENLKVVDQKLSEAVEPLHSAQEILDNAAKCLMTTTIHPACAEAAENHLETNHLENNHLENNHSENMTHESSNAVGSLLNELSESERAALQRLAIKIMANQNNTNLKRGEERGITKRNVFLPELEDYSEGSFNKLDRVQRDLFLAKNIESIVEDLTSHKRSKRNFHMLKNKPYLGDVIDNFDEASFHEDLYDFDGDTKHKSNSKHSKNNPDLEEEYSSTNKKKKKTIWRKLFGFTGGKSKRNRFLDQDQQNFQCQPKKKRKKV